MNSWTTKNSAFNVNIEQRLIRVMQSKGARFCKMSHNSDIDNKNSKWWEDDTCNEETLAPDGGGESKNKEEDDTCNDDADENQSSRKLKQDITVTTVDGDSVTGYITHWVTGPCSGTNEINWFIIQPGKYPTKYILTNELLVEDL